MSATPGRRVSVAVLRDTVRRAVAATSTHQTAKSIGLSQAWLRKFLNGAEPQVTTLDTLHEWHTRYVRENVAAAVETLVDALPSADRDKARELVWELFREAHRKLGNEPPPDWDVSPGGGTRPKG